MYDVGSAIWNGNVNGVWMPVERFLLYPTIGIPNGGPLWFLPCMFLTDLFYTVIARSVHGRQKRWAVILLIAVIGFAYSATEFMPELPWSLQPAMVALLFFQIGQVISNAETEGRRNVLHFPLWKLLLVGVTWLILNRFNVLLNIDAFESMLLQKFGIKICILFITLLGCTIVRNLVSHQKGILSLL